MVVFATASADLSLELCRAIPGDPDAKVAYLQEELHEHYPQVLITQTTNSLKVSGHWQEIIDLHSVLDDWYTRFINLEKQKHELALQQHELAMQQVQGPAAEGFAAERGSVLQPMHANPPSLAVVEGDLDAPFSASTIQSAGTQSVFPTQDSLGSNVAAFTSSANGEGIRSQSNEIPNNEMSALPQLTSIKSVDDILANVATDQLTSQFGDKGREISAHDKGIKREHGVSEANHGEKADMGENNQETTGTRKKDLTAFTEDPPAAQSDVETTLNTSTEFNLSTDVLEKEIGNIKSFIKSWSGRMKDQEVQTDGPELILTPSTGRRRGRKPGSPRKAKAHIPVKKESTLSDRIRTRPERFGSQADPLDSSDPVVSTPKRRRGRPKKNFANVLPEEMIPVNTESNVLNFDEDPTDQELPGFDDIELLPDDRDASDESHMITEPNSAVVLPTAPTDESPGELGQRSAKTKAILKVGVMAKDEEGLAIKEEKRGRKRREGPCINREDIDTYLPPDDIFVSGPFHCKLCSHSSKRRAALKQHYLRCHLERKFQCRTCGKRYGMLKELASHKLTHNRRHQCQLCERKFATQYLLEGHVERRHLNPKKRPSLLEENEAESNRQCPQCEFVAKSRKSLQDHVDRIHGEKTHPCPICNKMFALTKDLNQHVKFHSETYQCDECGKSLKSKLALKLHISGIHRGIKLAVKKEYVCEDCGKICRNKTHFKEHINKEHLHVKPYICDICPLAFFTKHALKCHGRVHSDIREFICDLCGKGFKNRSGLRVHRITHSEVAARPYNCGTCNKTFTQRGALVRHERIHSGDRPYKCRLCDSSFNDYSILRRHVVGVHKINDRALCGRVDIDPNAINRGRPKVPGPIEHPDSDILNTQKQAELLAQAALKVAQDMTQATIPMTMPSSTHSIETMAHHSNSFQTVMDNHHRSTPVNITPHASGIPTPVHTPGPKDLSQHTADSSNQLGPIELITIPMDSNSQAHTTTGMASSQPNQHGSLNSYSMSNMVPIAVVNDIVQNALYEQQHVLEGGYTIGMPVFPTPTTVANMHMMQPIHHGQHTITQLQPPPSSTHGTHTHRDRHPHV